MRAMQCSLGRAAYLAAVLTVASAAALGQGDGVVLKNATLYATPFDPPVANGVIVIRDGKIAAAGPRRAVRIPAGAEAIDCSGLTVTAGFWNSHVHFMERKWAGADTMRPQELAAELEAMLTRYGFTSVFDLSSPLANTGHIRRRVEAREVPGPRIRTTGEALIGKGWLPPDLVLRVLGNMVFPLHEITDAGGARAAARRNLDSGADGIKLFTGAQAPSTATLPEEAIRAAVEEAHRGGKPVFAHPSTREGLLAAARGRVDILAHTVPPSGVWDEALIRAVIQEGAALIPTLKIWTFQRRHDRLAAAEETAKTVTGQLRA